MCCLLLNMCFRSGKLKTDLNLTESEDELPYQKSVPCVTETEEDKPQCDNENISGLVITVKEKSSDTGLNYIDVIGNGFTKILESHVADTAGQQSEENDIDCSNGVTEKIGNLDDEAIVMMDCIVVEYVHPVPEVTVILEKDAESAMIVTEKSICQVGDGGNEMGIKFEVKDLKHEAKSVESYNKHTHMLNQNDQVVPFEDKYIAENVTIDETISKSEVIANEIVIIESFEVNLLDSNLEVKSLNSQSVTPPSEEVASREEECNEQGNMTSGIYEKEELNSDNELLPICNDGVIIIIDENNVDTTFKGDETVEELHSESFSDKRDVVGNKIDAIGISSCGDSDSNNNGS